MKQRKKTKKIVMDREIRKPIKTRSPEIKRYWFKNLHFIDKVSLLPTDEEKFMTGNYCFACGGEYKKLDRAHIIPDWNGGEDTPSNLHMLCKACHHQSEFLDVASYWQWFKNQHVGVANIYYIFREDGLLAQKIFDFFIKSNVENYFNTPLHHLSDYTPHDGESIHHKEIKNRQNKKSPN